MHIEFELPDEIAQALASPDLSRAALESLAAEGYRLRRLGNGQVRRILGFSTPMEVHAFLKERDIPLNYGLEEFEEDLATQERLRSKSAVEAKRSA
jgi:hypothetical protein